MRKFLAIICACMVTLTVACQDKDFYKKTNHYKGLYTTFVQFPDSSKLTTANLGSADWSTITGKPTIFPSSWEIVSNKPTLFPSSWELILSKPNFDALYKPIGYVPSWEDVTGKPTVFPSSWTLVVNKPVFATVATTGSYTDLLNIPSTFTPSAHNHDALYKPITYIPTWTEITGKPATYPSTWATVSGKPTFALVATSGSYLDLLNIPSAFTPTAHTHDYQTDITNKPTEQELQVAIAGLDFLPIPRKTTAQINALVMPANTSGFVIDITLNVLKFWDGTIWNVVITSH